MLISSFSFVKIFQPPARFLQARLTFLQCRGVWQYVSNVPFRGCKMSYCGLHPRYADGLLAGVTHTFMPYIYNKVIQECRKLNSKRFDSYFYIILTTTETTTTTRSNCSHRFHQVTKLQHGQQTIDSCQKHTSAKTNDVPVVLSHLWQTFKQYIPQCCPRCLCCRENLVNSPT